jgi:hypothetical protein
LHRVLQSHTERLCFTVWLDGHPSTVNKDEHNVIKVKKKKNNEEEEEQSGENQRDVVADLACHLRSNPSQRIISRAVYREEYEESLMEGHRGTEGLRQMLLLHRAHLQAVQKNEPLRELVTKLRQLKEQNKH